MGWYDVSVVIPCRNMHETIYRAIDSAAAAECDDIVVFDDASQPIINQTAKHHKAGRSVEWLIEYFVSNGVCHARNAAIAHTGYQLILPLDADDELLPGSIAELRSVYYDDQPGKLVYGGWYEDETYVSPPPPEMLTRKNVAHATWLFHRDDWQRVGGYDPDFNIGGEDYAFMVALVNAGVKPIRIDVPIYRKHVREGSRTDAARSRYPFIQQLLREKYPNFFA